MKKLIVILIVSSFLFVCFGCRRGDFQATTVFEGQKAPFSGWNFGPDIYIMEGQPCKVSGVLIWVKGIDPNDIIGTE